MIRRKFLLICFLFTLIEDSLEKLIGVIQFTRHGARTPLDYFEIFKEDFFPFGEGELTYEGFIMANEKGKNMRKLYLKKHEDFYSELEKNPKAIKIFSSPIQRTILTSLAYLKGLFPNFKLSYVQNEAIIDLNNLLQGRYPSLKMDKKFLKKMNEKEENKHLSINIEVFQQECRFSYKPKCVVLKETTSKEKENKKDILISNRQYRHILDFKSSYPRLFEEYCVEIYKRGNSMENDSNSDDCPEDTFKSQAFLSKIAGVLNSIDFHKLKQVNPELLNLSYISYIKVHHERIDINEAKIEGSNQMRYIKGFLSNVKNCNNNFSQSFEDFDSSNDPEEILNFLEKELHCRKYALFSLHDDNLYAIIRSLYDVQKDMDYLFDNFEIMSNEEINEYLEFYWPIYVSDFTFELQEDEENNEEYVRIFFNGKELKNKRFFSNILEYSEKGII